MITDRPIDASAVLEDFCDPACGAVVTFSGVVRAQNNGHRVTGIFYECYKAMAEKEIARIVGEVESEDPIDLVKVCHRVGEVPVGEVSLLVVVASAHRKAAYTASQTIVDRIKQRVPIWKKERYADETAQWI